MKVSRKVGRRSRFSVSRRRLRNRKTKNSYRKKYTQKGGRRGRGHKRAHTHKRGKRFHRGGTELIKLFVKKYGFKEQEQTFIMNITIREDNYANVELERTDNSRIKFTITAEPAVFIDFLQKLNYVGISKMGIYDFQELQDDNKNGTYDFFRTGNIAKFKEIAEKIAEKIKKAKYDNEAELLRGELEKAAEDKQLNPNDRLVDAKFNLALARVNQHDAFINHNSNKGNAEYENILDEADKLLVKAKQELNIQEAAVRFFN